MTEERKIIKGKCSSVPERRGGILHIGCWAKRGGKNLLRSHWKRKKGMCEKRVFYRRNKREGDSLLLARGVRTGGQMEGRTFAYPKGKKREGNPSASELRKRKRIEPPSLREGAEKRIELHYLMAGGERGKAANPLYKNKPSISPPGGGGVNIRKGDKRKRITMGRRRRGGKVLDR